MCATLLNGIYIAGALVAATLQVASLLVQSWFVADRDSAIGTVKHVIGLFQNCTVSSIGTSECVYIWNNLGPKEKAAAVCIILAVAFSALAVVWGCINCFVCCCRRCLTEPLPVLAGISFILDLVGVGLLIQSKDVTIDWFLWQAENRSFGLSMWVAVASVVVSFFTTVSGVALNFVSKICPC